jgi:hypothetical protein
MSAYLKLASIAVALVIVIASGCAVTAGHASVAASVKMHTPLQERTA